MECEVHCRFTGDLYRIFILRQLNPIHYTVHFNIIFTFLPRTQEFFFIRVL